MAEGCRELTPYNTMPIIHYRSTGLRRPSSTASLHGFQEMIRRRKELWKRQLREAREKEGEKYARGHGCGRNR